MKKLYFVEVTDTFGGEANYNWAHRFKVSATTMRGAMRKIAKRLSCSGGVYKDMDTGDMQRWNWRKACMCAFVEHYDDQSARMFHVESI
ncbi:hypothetical protein UFOVP654_81 [uncultured Caudovirales phage]|uniref:Uncharacterized protein n=1 Tax=uncultured Caudovirales phage TaxID=2100421 RepID=A0A6J5NAU4_9CAUD|nr:hypothetical protein UFOVP654_81 [uncultured Caudovirales phage]